MRLDLALVHCALLPSRERAKAAILAGDVTVNGKEATKPGLDVSEGDVVSLRKNHDYVGRGYLKLQKALDAFAIDVTGRSCMDVGASTGGFTQLLLERGAAKVHAIDVGTGQLAQSLKTDPRVSNLEKTDFRSITREQVGAPDFAGVDVSFISLKLILPNLFALLGDGGRAVCLLKPQFETGAPVKHGIVKNPKEHIRVITEVCDAARREGFAICGLTHSPIAGGEGNIEFLLHLSKNDPVGAALLRTLVAQKQLPTETSETVISCIVKSAWEDLKA